MAYADYSVYIERPVSEIFQFILDGENNKIWRPNVIDVKKASDDPIGVGTVFIQGIGTPKGIRISTDYEIIEIEDNKKMIFKVLKGPYKAIGTFKFETCEIKTKVTFSMIEETDSSAVDRTQHLKNVVSTLLNVKDYFDKQN